MMQKPLIHTFHFGDIRESIFSKLEWLLQQKQYVVSARNAEYSYITARTYYKRAPDGQCDVSIVLVQDGVLIHTEFSNQPSMHQRVWMLSGFMGYITYIEVNNPDLRHYLHYDPSSPTGNAYEMHATLQDAQLLEQILENLVYDMQHGTLMSLPGLHQNLTKLLPS